MSEADSDLTPASGAGSDFQGDLGLPTPEDTGSEAAGSPEDADPASSTDSSAGTPTEETGAPQEAAGEAALAKYLALGREWESEDAFTQHYKSMEGRVRAQGQENAKLNNLVDQWERWHDYQETSAKAAPTPAADATAKKSAEPFLEAIDWGAVKRLNDEKGFEHAMQAVVIGLQDHINTNVVQGIQAQIAEATAPIRESAAVQQADNEAKSWFYNAANTVDPESGEPLFPDLFQESDSFNKETATAIVNAWGNLVRTHPHFGLTPDGIRYAVTMGKESAQAAATIAAKPAQVAQSVQRDASGKFVKQAEGTATAEATGGVDTPDVVGEAQSVSEAEQTRRDIKNAGKGDARANFFGIA